MEKNFGAFWDKLQSMLDTTIATLPNIALATIILLIFYMLSGVARYVIIRLFRERRRNIASVLGRLTRWVIILFGIFVALVIIIPSFKAGDFIAFLGIGSVAVGFAFKDILQNFLSGILILLTEPFKVGDEIIVNNGDYEGKVTDILTRATIIKTYDGRRAVIPNSLLFTNSVLVNTAHTKRRSHYDVGIGYDDDINHAMDILTDAVNAIEGVLTSPPADVQVVELGDSAVILRCRWWTSSRQGESNSISSEVLKAIKYTCDQHGIDIPFPVQTVLLQQQDQKASQ